MIYKYKHIVLFKGEYIMFEYKMSETMKKELLKARKGADKKADRQAYLCKVVNEEFGLLYPVTKVI